MILSWIGLLIVTFGMIGLTRCGKKDHGGSLTTPADAEYKAIPDDWDLQSDWSGSHWEFENE